MPACPFGFWLAGQEKLTGCRDWEPSDSLFLRCGSFAICIGDVTGSIFPNEEKRVDKWPEIAL